MEVSYAFHYSLYEYTELQGQLHTVRLLDLSQVPELHVTWKILHNLDRI